MTASAAVRGSLWRWTPLLAAALGALAFLPSLRAGFVNWDDEASFLANPHFRGLGPAELRWMFTTTHLGHWSPLAWITWGLNYVVGGLDPRGYHAASLLLHTANVGLFCVVARRLLAAGFRVPAATPAIAAGALAAALVFGVHPLRAESVAWVSERRDLLCALFSLLAVLAYLRGVAGGGRITPRDRALSTAAFAAALLSKASAMTLPVLLLVIDVYPLRRRALGWRTLALEKWPYAVLAAAAAVIAVLARQDSGNLTEYGRYGAAARLALAGYTLWFYPARFVLPIRLGPMYELPASVGLGEPRFLLPVIGVLVITVALVLARHRWPAGLAAWASSAIALAPISGLVHSGNQLAADRYSYLSGFGLAVLAGAGLTWIIRAADTAGHRSLLPIAAIGSLAVIAALGARAWAQTEWWHDSETLWRRAVALDAQCSTCLSNLGRVIARPGRFEEAEAHVRRAIALRPERAGAHENLAVILLAAGRRGEAETEFRRVVALRPRHASSHNNLGVVLAGEGRDSEAEAEFRTAARLGPRLADAPANLGALLLRQARYEEAIPELRRALAIDPTRSMVRLSLARAYQLSGRKAEAEREAAALKALAPVAPEVGR